MQPFTTPQIVPRPDPSWPEICIALVKLFFPTALPPFLRVTLMNEMGQGHVLVLSRTLHRRNAVQSWRCLLTASLLLLQRSCILIKMNDSNWVKDEPIGTGCGFAP